MEKNKNFLIHNEYKRQRNKEALEGLVYSFLDGRSMILKEYISFKNCTVLFNDGTLVCNVNLAHFRTGSVRNDNDRNVFGVGFLGIGIYNSSKDKVPYDIWRGVIRRCYSKTKRKCDSMYENCTVHEYWHNFQNFAKWFYENYIDGFDLDKDLLVKGNKVYSQDTCCFLPSYVNSLFVTQKSRRNGLIGTRKSGNKFYSVFKVNNSPVYLGGFDTEQESFMAYKAAKEANIKKIANELKESIPEKVYNSMIEYKVELTD